MSALVVRPAPWPSLALANRADWRARAASTRARIAADGSPRRSSDNFWNGTRGTSTWMSIRSISGPLTRPMYRSIMFGEHLHGRLGSVKYPHGQGFIAATSMIWAGNRSVECTRGIVTHPSSSGWRIISSVVRGNSGNSSRKSTP